MLYIRRIQALFIAVISIVYLPFLTKSKLNFIKEDFRHFCNWKSYKYNLLSFIFVLLVIKSFDLLYTED